MHLYRRHGSEVSEAHLWTVPDCILATKGSGHAASRLKQTKESIAPSRIIMNDIMNDYQPVWIPIAAGPFTMGSDPRDAAPPFANERPLHRVELAEFRISRVPITNAQYL